MKQSILILFIQILVFSPFCNAQISDMRFRCINNEIQLSSPYCPYVFQDSYGLIWISTIDGVNVYDGHSNKVFKQKADVVKHKPSGIFDNYLQSTFFEDKKTGDIWFTSLSSINCYRRKLDQFEHFFIKDDSNRLIEEGYWALNLDENSNLLIKIRNGINSLYSFNINTFESKKLDATLKFRCNLLKKSESELILAEFDINSNCIYLNFIKNQKVERVIETPKNNFIKNISKTYYFDNKFYIVCENGIFEYTLGANSYNLIAKGSFLCLHQLDKERFIFINNTHFQLYNKTNKTIEEIVENKKIGIDEKIDRIYVDNNAGLWATCTYDAGKLYYCSPIKKLFKTIKSSQSNNILVNLMAYNEKLKKSVGVSNIEKKIYLIDTKNKKIEKTIPTPQNVNQFFFKDLLFNDDNAVFLSDYIKIFKYSLSSNKILNYNYDKNFSTLAKSSIYPSTKENLVIPTNKGIYNLAQNNVSKYKINGLNNDDEFFYGFVDSKGFFHVNEKSKFYSILRKNSLNELDLVQKNEFNIVIFDKFEDVKNEKLYLFTTDFIYVTDLKDYSVKKINSRFRGTQILSATVDDNGHFWFLTNEGLAFYKSETDEVRYFNQFDGLELGRVGRKNCFKSFDNTIFVAGTNGLFYFNPADIQFSTIEAKLNIASIKVNDVEKKYLWHQNNVTFNHDENYFSFDLRAIEYDNPSKAKLAYYLEGWDKGWDTCSTPTTLLRYNKLPYGSYTLHVATANADNYWSKNHYKIEFYIKPPFYLTWWFLVLSLLFILSIAYYYYKSQINRVRNEEQLKAKLIEVELQALRAQINPHFMNNCLNAISGFILKQDFHNSYFYLTKFSRLMRLILEHSKSEFIKLDEEIDALKYYIEMEALRFSSKFTYEINIDKSLSQKHIEIAPMLIQPFVENAIWHGLLPQNYGNLSINFSLLNNALICIIEDNGIGRKKSSEFNEQRTKKRKSFGIEIIKERIKILKEKNKSPNGNIEIIDLYNAENQPIGTKVIITIPSRI